MFQHETTFLCGSFFIKNYIKIFFKKDFVLPLHWADRSMTNRKRVCVCVAAAVQDIRLAVALQQQQQQHVRPVPARFVRRLPAGGWVPGVPQTGSRGRRRTDCCSKSKWVSCLWVCVWTSETAAVTTHCVCVCLSWRVPWSQAASAEFGPAVCSSGRPQRHPETRAGWAHLCR